MIDSINLEEYDYNLPDDRIAQSPLADRDSSKLLVYDKGTISENTFRYINKYIPDNSFLILNNTKVINARILFKKKTGAKIEIFCLEPLGMGVEKTFGCTEDCTWNCIVGNASKWRDEILEKDITIGNSIVKLSAEKTNVNEDGFCIKFKWNDGHSFSDVLDAAGSTPLPPYIKRKAEPYDRDRYQTVFAETNGSVAAPTAGLHFTKDVFNDLKNKNILHDFITLNVGVGTFKPIKTNDVTNHKMHEEIFSVRRSFLENLLQNFYSSKVAVGTTSVRTLESLYWLGIIEEKLKQDNLSLEQWEVYDHMDAELPKPQKAIENLIAYLDKRGTNLLNGSTSLMIMPGYKFKIIDMLITNFHLPKSTLLLLISAFTGPEWKKIYDYALKNEFRFLSYGDSSIIIP